jgi:hypothetical protein
MKGAIVQGIYGVMSFKKMQAKLLEVIDTCIILIVVMCRCTFLIYIVYFIKAIQSK